MAITFEIIDPNVRASGVFVETKNVRNVLVNAIIPQRIAIFGQYDPAKTLIVPNEPITGIENADQAADKFGFGSMLHIMARKLFAQSGNVDATFFPIEDDGAGVDATGTITVTGPATSDGSLYVYIAGQKNIVSVSNGDADSDIATAIAAAINGNLTLPVTALATLAVVDITANWAGETGNEITIKENLAGDVESKANPAGVSLAIVDMASGANNPDASTALGNMGNTWQTVVAFPYQDTDNLTALDTVGDQREAPDVRRFFAAIIGSVRDKAAQITFVGGLNSKWISSFPAANSVNMQLEIAAELAGLVGFYAQPNPARTFRLREMFGTRAGYKTDPLLYPDKNDLVLAGSCSSVIGTFGELRIGDLVTTYNENEFAFRDESWMWLIDTLRRQAKIFSIETVFSGAPFTNGIVVDNDSPADIDYAVRPNYCAATLRTLVRGLWAPLGWSKNIDQILAGITAEINPTNPGRIDCEIPDIESSGLRIIAVKYKYSFFSAQEA